MPESAKETDPEQAKNYFYGINVPYLDVLDESVSYNLAYLSPGNQKGALRNQSN
jgi:hypothetical protein